jgi:hypothetical protein
MGAGSDKKARAERAARLREQIEELQRESSGKEGASGSADAPARKLSPREFIHKRMRELSDKK